MHVRNENGESCSISSVRSAANIGVFFSTNSHAALVSVASVLTKVVAERLEQASTGITLNLYSLLLPEMLSEPAGAFSRITAR